MINKNTIGHPLLASYFIKIILNYIINNFSNNKHNPPNVLCFSTAANKVILGNIHKKLSILRDFLLKIAKIV